MPTLKLLCLWQAKLVERKKAESYEAILYAPFGIAIIKTNMVVSSTGAGYHHPVGVESESSDGIAAVLV